MSSASPDGARGEDVSLAERDTVDVPLLVARLPADEAGWVAEVPAAPAGARITASLTEPADAIRHAADLLALGYVPVGAAGGSDGRRWADFGVPVDLAERERGWLQRLLGPEGLLLNPTFGPVRLLLADVLATHRGPQPPPDSRPGAGMIRPGADHGSGASGPDRGPSDS